MENKSATFFESGDKRKVLLGITGSIAAYKAAELARLLVSWGYEVRTVMTESAQQFITPLTMQSITNNIVTTQFWEAPVTSIGHIELADWADAFVIAPATADVIAKLAHGFADSPILAMALATRAPILVAPAMNVNMLGNDKTQENIQLLKKRGVEFVDPEEGHLACGWNGAGRLADPWEIFWHVRRVVSRQDFLGKNILISTGPTREALDPVRFLTNRSSGKMGVALAREAFRRGANVTLVHGPITQRVPQAVNRIPVTSAVEMHEKMLELTYPKSSADDRPDAVIMSAAVADYRPAKVADVKLKKTKETLQLDLVKNPDILSDLGKRRKDAVRPVLVGFAVETGEIDELVVEARRKLESKKCDLIVGNFAEDAFDLDTNRVWLVDRNGKQEEISTTYKSRVANKILDQVLKL